MPPKPKFFYMVLGSIITLIGLTFTLTTLLPAFAGEIYMPLIISNSGDTDARKVGASSQELLTDSKRTIPILPTIPYEEIKPTGTPVFDPDRPTPEAQPGPSGGWDISFTEDLAPNIPVEDKASVTLQYPDGKRAEFLMVPDKIEEFLSAQPEDVLLVTTAPPASMMGHRPPTPDRSKFPAAIVIPPADIPPPPSFNNQ